jgi:hypothetical protein
MSISIRKAAWFLMSGTLLLIGISFCLWPAGNTLSEEQVKQRQSDSHLQSISKWVLAYMDAHEGKRPLHLSDLLNDEQVNLRTAFQAPSTYTVRKPLNWLENTVLLDNYTDYSIYTNSSLNSITLFPGQIKTGIVAHEKIGLWADDTVGVYFTRVGVLRLKTSVFNGLLAGYGQCLVYDKKTHLWRLEE